jgi:hypothetical protein
MTFSTSSYKYINIITMLFAMLSSPRTVVLGFSRSTFLSSRLMTRTYSSTKLSMKLQTAIVGLPNVGKVRSLSVLVYAYTVCICLCLCLSIYTVCIPYMRIAESKLTNPYKSNSQLSLTHWPKVKELKPPTVSYTKGCIVLYDYRWMMIKKVSLTHLSHTHTHTHTH